MNILTSPNQIAFIKGRYILESVVLAHETIHLVVKKGQKGAILKLDYEKAFDKVNLDFLDELLDRRNFSPFFRRLIRQVARGDSMAVKLNGVEGNFFTTGKGLRQGDPLSPLLFNFVVDIFTRMLSKAVANNLIKGLCTDVVPDGVIGLQYADDTILFVDSNPKMAKNLKWVLTCFEHVSGMKVNYNKSKLVPLNLEPDEAKNFKKIFDCSEGSFPIKYLGVLLHYDKLRKEDLQPIIDKILKRIAG
jgi:mannosylglycoprotein endo-beta-mannosidase